LALRPLIAHGGHGQITDVQQQRYGQQVMDVLLPFQGVIFPTSSHIESRT
jgi:hypothetical protein